MTTCNVEKALTIICSCSDHVKQIIGNMIRMLRNRQLKLTVSRCVFYCLAHLLEKCEYAKGIFIDLEGEHELSEWLEHPNEEIRHDA